MGARKILTTEVRFVARDRSEHRDIILWFFKIRLSFIFNDSNGKSHVFENWVSFVPITFQVNWQKYTVGN